MKDFHAVAVDAVQRWYRKLKGKHLNDHNIDNLCAVIESTLEETWNEAQKEVNTPSTSARSE